MPGLFSELRPITLYGLVQPKSSTTAIISVNIDTDQGSVPYPNVNSTEVLWQNDFAQIVQWQNNSSQIVEWVSIGTNWFIKSINAFGVLIGFTVYSTSEDFSLVALSMDAQLHDWRV
jgi:hypothetical protein